MTPETAVSRLAEILVNRADFTEDSIYAAMAQAGIPTRLADRAYKFTQVAWGRILLDGLVARFSPEFLWLNADGVVVESGPLAEDPCFVTATKLASQFADTPGFRRLASMSADVHAVNTALHAGTPSGQIIGGPAIAFLEPPTSAGVARARSILEKYLKPTPADASAAIEPAPQKKPWWRWW